MFMQISFLLRYTIIIHEYAEDYRGPSNAGYFKWLPDPETGELKPVTRLREVNIEKKR
jgi:hypothetical protein